jgi:hypothetical protein
MTDTLDSIVIDNWGWAVKATFTESGVATAIDSYTTLEIIFVSPSGEATTKAAADGVAFFTDGTDGILAYTVEDALIDEAGTWTIYGRVTKGTGKLTSLKKTFDVAHI